MYGNVKVSFTFSELVSQVPFVQKSPIPLFQRRKLEVSLCKGRFRGIFVVINTTLTRPWDFMKAASVMGFRCRGMSVEEA